jgi:hydroxymethylbilane synthase
VTSRIQQLTDGHYDALLLAAAGLDRLRIRAGVHRIPTLVLLPAPAQGALALQIRRNDDFLVQLVRAVSHTPTWRAVRAERAFLAAVGESRGHAVAALARHRNGRLVLQALVGSAEGDWVARVTVSGPADRPAALGRRAARRALERSRSWRSIAEPSR